MLRNGIPMKGVIVISFCKKEIIEEQIRNDEAMKN